MQKTNPLLPADSDLRAKLIEASNLLARFITENINEGWQLTLSYTKGEASMELTDPDGDEIHVDSEYGLSTEDLACIASFID